MMMRKTHHAIWQRPRLQGLGLGPSRRRSYLKASQKNAANRMIRSASQAHAYHLIFTTSRTKVASGLALTAVPPLTPTLASTNRPSLYLKGSRSSADHTFLLSAFRSR